MEIQKMDNDYLIESKLSTSLNTVQPDPGFVHTLYERLTQPASLQIEKVKSSAIVLILGIGMFVGAIIIWVAKAVRKR